MGRPFLIFQKPHFFEEEEEGEEEEEDKQQHVFKEELCRQFINVLNILIQRNIVFVTRT